jgi:hypothetical protein
LNVPKEYAQPESQCRSEAWTLPNRFRSEGNSGGKAANRVIKAYHGSNLAGTKGDGIAIDGSGICPVKGNYLMSSDQGLMARAD